MKIDAVKVSTFHVYFLVLVNFGIRNMCKLNLDNNTGVGGGQQNLTKLPRSLI